jgi:hypothetical protein
VKVRTEKTVRDYLESRKLCEGQKECDPQKKRSYYDYSAFLGIECTGNWDQVSDKTSIQ